MSIADSRCPACGAEIAGSPKFCTVCGHTLPRAAATAPAQATRADPEAERLPLFRPPPGPRPRARPPRDTRSTGQPRPRPEYRRLAIAGAVAAAVLTLVILVAAGAFSGGGEGERATTASSARARHPAPAPDRPAADTPTDADVRALLQAYAERYSAEDTAGLGALFTADATRQNGDDPVEDRARALAEYQRQFDDYAGLDYTLEDKNVDRAPGAATVRARYRITSTRGTTRGAITFYLVERGSRLAIRRLEIVPDT